ncbi:MAG TPA: NAD(P)H-hydrate dehydratase, partial [Campylobacterales bacterium]|nr:NAD(P)H-hydrate dehydratase [Campylobacterales bacterium]
ALFSDMAKDYVGEVIRVDLGVHYDKYTEGFETDTFLLEECDLKLPSRNWSKMTHKGSFGHLAVIAGEKEGAGLLSGSAGLRFGAGLVTMVGELATPLPLAIMQESELPYNTTAIAFGMGFGEEFGQEIVEEVVEHEAPIVLDADIFYSETVMAFLEQKGRDIVLTPHPKEFVALWHIAMETPLNVPILQANRLEKVREFCEAYPHVTLLLKGANMIIAKDQQCYINPHGSSKLSKGGSGDVLSGLIGALLAQGENPLDATISASLALTTAAQAYDGASYAMLPTDIIEEIGRLETRSNSI